MVEEWKDIQGFEECYQVSNKGKVRSKDRWVKNGNKSNRFVKGQEIVGCSDKDGYKIVLLSKNNKKTHWRVHKLVATTFELPNPNGYVEINHKDDNKENNHLDNLEWCSRSYNNTYNGKAIRTGKTQMVKIAQFSLDGKFIRNWDSAKIVERELGFCNTSINSCCRGKAHTAYGYVWKYA